MKLTKEDLGVILSALHNHKRAEIEWAIKCLPREKLDESIEEIRNQCDQVKKKVLEMIDKEEGNDV
jgi:hypothetical protein